MAWWYAAGEDGEYLWGPHPTREEAIAAGRANYADGDDFAVCEGERFQNRADIFDGDWIADRFDDANEEHAGEDPASEKWKPEHIAEIERELEATFGAWLDRHGYRGSWAIDAKNYEKIVGVKPATN